jgi:hypothetical protein
MKRVMAEKRKIKRKQGERERKEEKNEIIGMCLECDWNVIDALFK